MRNLSEDKNFKFDWSNILHFDFEIHNWLFEYKLNQHLGMEVNQSKLGVPLVILKENKFQVFQKKQKNSKKLELQK